MISNWYILILKLWGKAGYGPGKIGDYLHISFVMVVALASDTFPEQTQSLQKSSQVTAAWEFNIEETELIGSLEKHQSTDVHIIQNHRENSLFNPNRF
jgi:hypothetical protein